MVKFVRNLVVLLLVCAAPAARTFAQLHPMPGSKSEPAVICAGCKGNNYFGQPNDGLKTYPHSSPIKDHVGRYVDSTSTASFQAPFGFRTARARQILTVPQQRGTAPPRVYIVIGSAIAAYPLDTFFTQLLPAGMVSIKSVKTGIAIGGFGRTPPEDVLMFGGMVYPDSTASKWFVPFQDKQDNIGTGSPMDVDDRGYLYAAYTYTGWGIVRDDGRNDGSHFPSIVQLTSAGTSPITKPDTSNVDPESIVAMKSGTKYYVVTASSSKEAVWDVTDPATPKFTFRRDSSTTGIKRFDRNDDAKHVAVINRNGHVRIYEYADFATSPSPSPIYENSAGFTDLAYDESGNLWAAEKANRIWKFSPAGNSYTATPYSPHSGKFEHLAMHVAAGHVFVQGKDYANGLAYDARLLKIEAGGLRDLDMDGFFKKYYHSAPADHAQPAGYNNPEVMGDVQIVKSGGKTYLMYSTVGLGDVYEIEGNDSISIKVKSNNYGTTNPNSKGVAGPYVGDIVTFSAPSSNPQVIYDVTWDFGNAESSDNTTLKKSNVEIAHQYTGLNTAAKVTSAKTVRAITVQDSQISSQYSLSLKLPTPRVGINGVSTPITASTSNVQVVDGQTFNDASDGSIEGHYGSWTIDGTTTKVAPNGIVPVGEVGAHTLEFQGAYGKYDGSFNISQPYLTPALTINYTVLPFKATIDAPTAVGTNVKFTGTPLVAASPTVTAGTWSVTWTFNPGGTSTAAVTTQTTQSPINTIPDFTIPKADVVTGSTVTLKVEVETAGLSTPAQRYTSFTSSMTLSAPDPVITKSGCANVGSPCSFTASSPSDPSMTGWTLLWTVTGPSGTKTSSANPYSPTLTVAGTHTVTLKATKSIFEKTASTNVTVEPSLCQPLPQPQNVSITKVGCSSGCAPGTTVTFWPSMQGYSAQACDTFEWNFGSGQGTATGEEVTHTYATAGTFTVSLKITNPNGNLTKTTTVVVSNGGTDPGGPTCTAPTAPTVSYTGCSAGGCKTSDNITFNVKRGTASLQSCDTVAWTFSDGSTSSSRTPVKKFSTAGTYTASVVISNSKGTSPSGSATVTVTTAPSTGNCSTAPGPGNFAILFQGATCTNSNGQPCQPAETINFSAQDYFYAPGSCDKYEWDFGDSSAKVLTREATHTFATSGSFPVKLRVHNNAGEWTYSRTVVVQGTTPGKPQPQLTATTFPANGVKGRTITFTATSNMATTTGWTWSFGDNSGNDTSQASQTKQSSTITHTFTRTGTFTVRATARNSEDIATAPVGVAQGTITIADAPAIPEYRFLLPDTAHLAGQGGSQWRTDVQIYSTDPAVGTEAKPLEMEALFNGVTYPLHQIKSTHIYEDFVGQLLNQQKDGRGPIIITTKNASTAPMIWTRTYNQSVNGTFGQYIPAIRIDAAAGGAGTVAEGKYYLAGLRHDERYRTNLGFLNPNSAAITATVTVFDDDHFAINQFTRTLQPFQLDPITSLTNLVPNLPTNRPFSLEISVPSGNWLVAYASFINNKTQDPVYLQAVRDNEVASPDFTTTVIPGVGHTGPWRSDVTIFNPDSQGLEFTLQYYDANGVKLAETPGIRIDPRKFIQYGDIIKQGVLGNVVDGLGTLKIVNTSLGASSMLQPMSFASTYNDDGANGTFGQGIPAFAAARPNVRPNKPAMIAGVRNIPGQYYTNIGLLNLADTDVTATVTLLDPVSGNAVASIPYTLKPNQTVVGRFNGWGAITSGTFKIEANGNVWAFCSAVDDRTKDPTYISATPLVP
ncbi:MAG TPA: PKD domain-containing protein [Thermoanaerobaculia bacterium]